MANVKVIYSNSGKNLDNLYNILVDIIITNESNTKEGEDNEENNRFLKGK